MRQRWLSVLLVLFLLFGQSAASVHVFTHLQPTQSNPCATPTNIDQCGPAHEVCPECLVLAALAVAAPLAVVLLLPACSQALAFPPHPQATGWPPARGSGTQPRPPSRADRTLTLHRRPLAPCRVAASILLHEELP